MNSEPELTQEDWTNYIQNSENNDVQDSYTTSSNPNYPIFLGKFVKIKEVPTDTQSKQDTAGQYYYGNNLKTYEFENKNLKVIYNCANDGCPSHYEFAEFITRFLQNKTVNRIEKLKRSFSNYGRFYMNLEKLKKIIDLDYWQCDVEKYFETVDI